MDAMAGVFTAASCPRTSSEAWTKATPSTRSITAQAVHYGVDKPHEEVHRGLRTPPVRAKRMFAEYAEWARRCRPSATSLNAWGCAPRREVRREDDEQDASQEPRLGIGEYRHGDIVVEGGMPALVDEETF